MSGIVGILNLDGAPLDRDLLARMTQFMVYQGPDAQDIWIDGNIGLGHTLLRTTWEAETEKQPLTLDGKVWLTADARIDGRDELIRKLESLLGKTVTTQAGDNDEARVPNDAELILLSYHAWGRNCIEHLLGDFAFAVWDSRERTLFCARDHFGVKPFYYSVGKSGFLFSNNLACLRLHPSVGEELEPAAIGDFLLFGFNHDTTTTTFRDIKRSALVDKAFNQPKTHVVAHTIIYRSLLPDDEDFYSKLTADALKIPIKYQIADEYELFKSWERPEIRPPEPSEDALLETTFDQLRLANEDSRVALTGYGPDPALKMSATLGLDRLRRFQIWKLTHAVAWFLFSEHSLPRIGFRGALKGIMRKTNNEAPFPSWLDPNFVSRAQLKERWNLINSGSPIIHSERPQGYRSLTDPFWSNTFESYDPGITRVPIEVRHPFFDVRMMSYLISIPQIPWCVNKYLLRESMRGILPESIRLRPKTVLRGDPIARRIQQHGVSWIDDFEAHPKLLEFVDRNQVPKIGLEKDSDPFWRDLRPLCLDLWPKIPRRNLRLANGLGKNRKKALRHSGTHYLR